MYLGCRSKTAQRVGWRRAVAATERTAISLTRARWAHTEKGRPSLLSGGTEGWSERLARESGGRRSPPSALHWMRPTKLDARRLKAPLSTSTELSECERTTG